MPVTSCRCIALALILLSAAALHGDVLVLADGSRISGRLTYCDEQICSIDKRRIALDQIARIDLGEDSNPSLAPRGATVILHDGTSRRERFTGLNLGYVFVDEEEIGRKLVAAIFPGDDGKAAADLLVAADGSIRSGTLERCNAASCTLDGSPVALEAIRWIGLGQEGESPPAATASTIFFAESDSVTARLSAVDATNVDTTRGSFPRSSVTWIHVAFEPPAAPPPSGTAQRPPGGNPHESPPTGRPPGQPPPPPPAADPSPPVAPPPPSGARDPILGTPGAYWSGTVHGRFWAFDGYSSHVHTFSIRLRAREFGQLVAIGGQTLYQSLILVNESLSYAETYESQEYGPGGTRCEGSGESTVLERGGMGSLQIRKGTTDVTPQLGFDLPADGGIYEVHFAIENGHRTYPIRCRNSQAEWSNENGFQAPIIGRYPSNPWSGNPSVDPDIRYLEDGRMRGSFAATLASYHSAVSWSICREDADCPPPPELPGEAPEGTIPPRPPSDDPCGEIAGKQEQIGRIGRQAAELRPEYNERVRARDAARDGLWGFSGSLAKFFNSLGGLAAEGLVGDWGTVIGLASANVGLWQELNDFSEFQAAIEVASLDQALEPATRAAVRAACQAAEEYILVRPDDVQGAFNILNSRLDAIGASAGVADGGIQALSIAPAVYDYKQNTEGLADGLSGYYLARQEAANVERDLERLDEQIRDLQMEIEELRARCAREGGAASTPEPRAMFASWRGGDRAPVLLAAQGPPPSVPAGGEDPILGNIRELSSQLAGIQERLNSRVTPRLLPFISGDWRTVDPRLLQRLVLEVRSDLERVASDLERAQNLGREIGVAAREANPQPPV